MSVARSARVQIEKECLVESYEDISGYVFLFILLGSLITAYFFWYYVARYYYGGTDPMKTKEPETPARADSE